MNLRAEDLKFDERGLIAAIVQDAKTDEVLTLAYMNAESLERTLETGETWFWSRSRSELWHKGETSGHTQRVVDLRPDCDQDALLVLVEPSGPACHTGARTCFHHQIARDGNLGSTPGHLDGGSDLGTILAGLFSVVQKRREEMPEGSYTAYLFKEGLDKILKKIGEEAAETIIAAKNADAGALTAEMSDLIYHLVVLMVERGLTLEAIGRELCRRSAGQQAQ